MDIPFSTSACSFCKSTLIVPLVWPYLKTPHSLGTLSCHPWVVSWIFLQKVLPKVLSSYPFLLLSSWGPQVMWPIFMGICLTRIRLSKPCWKTKKARTKRLRKHCRNTETRLSKSCNKMQRAWMWRLSEHCRKRRGQKISKTSQGKIWVEMLHDLGWRGIS